MDQKLKSAIEKMKAAMAEMDACMSGESQEENSDMMQDSEMQKPQADSSDKKSMVKALLKQKGY